jgi:hypothetical protein
MTWFSRDGSLARGHRARNLDEDCEAFRLKTTRLENRQGPLPLAPGPANPGGCPSCAEACEAVPGTGLGGIAGFGLRCRRSFE